MAMKHPCQVVAVFTVLSMIGWMSTFLKRPRKIGSPRYLTRKQPLVAWKSCRTSSRSRFSHLMGATLHLAILVQSPAIWRILSRISAKFLTSRLIDLRKKMSASSAYMEILSLVNLLRSGVGRRATVVRWSSRWRGSIAKWKSIRENQSPWRSPPRWIIGARDAIDFNSRGRCHKQPGNWWSARSIKTKSA
jgi:hypothetical protein